MRLLYLTNGFPYPLTSGYLRHYFLLRELSARHDVTLLSLAGPGYRPEHAEAVRPFARRIEVFPAVVGRSRARRAWRRLRSLVAVEPPVRAMRSAVADLARETRFDAVFCGKRTLAAIEPVADVPLIADLCDATAARIAGSLRRAGPARLPFLLLELAHTRRIEREMMRRAAHSVFISVRDREATAGSAAARSSILPNGVDLDFWRRTASKRNSDMIIFTGAMHYRPNADAALHLIESIFPRVQQAIPKAKLFIVGRDPSLALRAAGRRLGVEVTGFVDDVRPFLEAATVFAAPLRIGSGMQNKVLEAMAMEVPVVASPLAADGLRTPQGEVPPIEVARGAEAFADALTRALIDAQQDPSPDGEGRRYVERHFDWGRSGALLDRIITDVGGGGPLPAFPPASRGEPATS